MSALRILGSAQKLVDKHAKLSRELRNLEKEMLVVGVELKKLMTPARSTSLIAMGAPRTVRASVGRSTSKPSTPRASTRKKHKPRNMSSAWGAAQLREVKKLYVSGMTSEEIAKKFNSCGPVILRILRKQRVKIRPRGAKQSNFTVTAENPSGKILEVIQSMATKGVVSLAKVRKEGSAVFGMSNHSIGQCIRVLELKKKLRIDGDIVHLAA